MRRLPVTGTGKRTKSKTWHAEINIVESGSDVRAEARLRGKEGGQIIGEGTARCNPTDENVPAIGDELAVARAMSDLSHQLLSRAAHDIEVHTARPVERLHA
ncbi:DUF1876 domain-containing protein [Streptomyces sp. NPDC058000]|uniref:DUF1876 domain-containing protein n=1 Tax=Streptomyces sp. NPDC058000 TaxID=3346299 RepID=UPI0036E81CEE